MDLPAFGKPTSPASAMTFSSSEIQRSSPSSPGSNCRGVRLVDDCEVTCCRARRGRPCATVTSSPVVDQVLEHVAAVAVADDGAGRDEDDEVVGVACRGSWRCRRARRSWPSSASCAMSGARLSAFGSARTMTRPAVAAVAAVGPALGDVLLPPERRPCRGRRRRPSRTTRRDRRTWSPCRFVGSGRARRGPTSDSTCRPR